MNVGAISLGCDKNRVDTERLLGYVENAGHTIVNSLDEAELVVINTCAFLQSAVKESIDTIFEVRSHVNVKYVVVAGCLPMRYLKEITDDKEGLSEVDAFLDNSVYDQIGNVIDRLQKGEKVILTGKTEKVFSANRVITTPYHYAYLKIADGCNNHCTFCAIPGIRGPYRSTKIEDLVKEATDLINNGVKELILVAQDVTRYGEDLYGENRLIDLLKELIKLPVERVRLFYCYPDKTTDELIDFIDEQPKMAKYIDMPMQHAADSVLKRMNRKDTQESLRNRIAYIRSKKNRIAIRSTFMVGFPQETPDEFEELCSFLREEKLDHVGFFAYSKEENTPAALMKGQLSHFIKNQRLSRVIAVQSRIAQDCISLMIGRVIGVIYDGIDYDKQKFYGHTDMSAPDVDEKIYFTADIPVEIGETYPVLIEKVLMPNVYGKVVEEKE